MDNNNNNNLILDMDKLLELQAKASKVDAIIAYVSSCDYINKKVVLALAGVLSEESEES